MRVPRRIRRAGPVAALILLPLAVYVRSLAFDFVRADDSDLIAGNQAFLTEWANLPRAFHRSYFDVAGQPVDQQTYYRPIVIASFMLDAHLAGARPAVYHATNVAIHIAVVLLLFRTLAALGAGGPGALAIALVFAVHPLGASVVAWIPGRNDSLLALFALASLVALARYAARPAVSTFAVHVGALALALFTKETAIALPAAFVLWAWLWESRPRLVVERPQLIAAYAAVCAAWLALRGAALGGSAGVLPGPYAYATTALANSPQILLDLGKALFPIRLGVAPGVDAPGLALGAAALGITGWTLVRIGAAGQAAPRPCDARARRGLFGAVWFVIFLVPSLIVPSLPAYEHRVYVPMLGLALIASQVSFRPAAAGRRRARPALAIVLLAVLLAILLARTAVYVEAFRDPIAYWRSAARAGPWAPLALVNLGLIDEERGDLERAAGEYRAALARDPGTPKAHNNLGVVLVALGRPAEAEASFEEEIRLHAGNAEAYYNLGVSYKHEGRWSDSVALWEKTIALDSHFADAYRQLAEYYEAKGDRATAEGYRMKAAAGTTPTSR